MSRSGSHWRALLTEEAVPGFHLYAPERPMRNWVFIPSVRAELWESLARSALAIATPIP